jgi:PAS domain S-box-containing protein
VLSGILDAFPEFVIVVDRDGVVRYINRVEHGYDRDAVIGMHASSILSPDSLDGFQSAFETVLETGLEQQYDSMVHSHRARLNGIEPACFHYAAMVKSGKSCFWQRTSPN